MKKALTKPTSELYYYVRGERIKGENKDMWGDCSGLWGNCSGLWGDCSGLRGDCSGLKGNCSDLWGDCSGLKGDLDDCEITAEEREKGVNIQGLVKD